jgi:hypothetical protein
MVAMGHGGKRLQTAIKKDCLGAVLILLGDEQIDISVAGQTPVNPFAAFPVEVGDVVSIKVIQDHQHQGQNRALGGRAGNQTGLVQGIVSHLLSPFRLNDLAISNA